MKSTSIRKITAALLIVLAMAVFSLGSSVYAESASDLYVENIKNIVFDENGEMAVDESGKPKVTFIVRNYSDDSLAKEGPDYTVEDVNFNSAEGILYYSILDSQGNHVGDSTNATNIIREADITLSKTTFTYNKADQMPDVTVTFNGTTLSEGEDFELDCPDSVKPGTYEIGIEGINGYYSQVKATFTIKKATQKVKGTAKYKPYATKKFKLNAKTTGNGKLVYKSSNTKVLKVSSKGVVTPLKKGKATISVYAAASSLYNKSAVKKISVSVLPKPKTSKKYKKFVGKWKTVDYTMNIKVVNKGYLTAVLKNRKGDKVVIDQKINAKKTIVAKCKSKKGATVKVYLKLKWGPLIHYRGGSKGIEGIQVSVVGNKAAWMREPEFFIINGKKVRSFLIYTKFL